MSVTKEASIIKSIKEILEDREKEGITQNQLIGLLENRGICTRTVFYRYKQSLMDGGVFELRRVGKQQERCFLTEKLKKINTFKLKIKNVENLLEIVTKHPLIGDCFTIFKNDNVPELTAKNYGKILNWREYTLIEYLEGKSNQTDLYSLQARHDLVKNLPEFLSNYIYDSRNKFSDGVKKDCLVVCEPIFNKCREVLRDDYTETSCYSNQFKKKSKVGGKVYSLRGRPTPDVRAEFLKILGRYYFTIGKELSKGFKYESVKEQKTITMFVESFFSSSNIVSEEIDKSITSNDIDNYWMGDRRKTSFKEGVLERLTQVSASLGYKFAKQFSGYNDHDALVIFNYYKKWLFTYMGSHSNDYHLFSQIEKTIINGLRVFTEDYEEEALELEHEDPLENPPPGSEKRGQLICLQDGKPAIEFNEDFDYFESLKGRKLRIFLEL